MVPLYDTMIFVSVGLATVVGAVYAVASTFLGRALAEARRDQEKAHAAAQDEFQKVMADIREAVDKSDIRRSLGKAEWAERIRKLKGAWRRLNAGPQLLAVTHTVVLPGALFLATAVFSAAAKAKAEDAALRIPDHIWWAGVLTLTLGLWRLVSSLRAIQAISSTSEEAAFSRQVAALGQALREDRAATLPNCYLRLSESSAPLVAGQEGTIVFEYGTDVAAATNVSLNLFLPTEFEFLGEKVGFIAASPPFKGQRRLNFINGATLPPGVYRPGNVKVRAPEKPGTYQLGFWFSVVEVRHPSSAVDIEVVAG